MVRQSQRERLTPEEERESVGGTGGIDLIGEDLLQNILSRLPALTFASAACVSRSWNTLCNRVLSLPKLSSAFSLNHSLQVAVEVVVDKVLSEPLRPHFAIACISPTFNLRLAHKLITEKLGSTTPVVTYESMGIMGRNALTNEFKEVQWDLMQEDPGCQTSGGILLVVGFVPGLKVDAVPLMQSNDPQFPLVDKFVMDIRHYTASVSGCSSPAGIIMFGAPGVDMKPVLEKMDYAMAMETVIVGDESGHFLHRGQDDMQNTNTENCNSSGVALLFVRDRNKPDGIGEIEFCVTSSTGLSPIGPTFKAAAVREGREDCSTWLTARREEQHGILDGNTMLDDINDEIGDRIEYPVLYIGVKKRRKCCVGLEKERWVTSLAFYEVTEGDEEYLYLRGRGIRTRDSFRFYCSDSSIASSSCTKVTENLQRLKQDWDNKVCHDARGDVARGKKKEVFGGIIFSCCGRGESFFGHPYVDSSPFLENFPGVPLAGTFCCGEIGRGSSSLYDEEAEEQSDLRCCLHVYSSFCLVMSYTPAQCQCR